MDGAHYKQQDENTLRSPFFSWGLRGVFKKTARGIRAQSARAKKLFPATLNKITEQNKTQNTIQRYELRNRRDSNNTKTRISDANIQK